MARPLPIAVLVSGEGTTLDGLADLAARGALAVRIVLVVADRPGTPAIDRARARGLATLELPSRGSDPAAWSDRLTAALVGAGAEVVVQAGFLSILPDAWVDRWYGRAINVHPSLLPRYGGRGMYGARVHRAVLAAGEPETGATVHLVAREVDAGPVIAQERVAVRADDTPETLRGRLRPVEIRLLAATLARFADGALPLPYRAAGAAARDRRRGDDAAPPS